MHTKFLIIFLSVLFISCEEKHALRLNLTPGKIYKQTVLTQSHIYEDDIDSWADIEVSTFYKIDYKVTKREDSIFTLSCKLKEMIIEFESDFDNKIIDSKERDSGNPLDKIISNYNLVYKKNLNCFKKLSEERIQLLKENQDLLENTIYLISTKN